jgi:hypothetical protein
MNPNQGREAAYVTSRVKDLSLITNAPDYVGLFACITPKAHSSLEDAENVVYLDANGNPTDDHSEDNKVYLPQLVRDVETLTELFGDPRVDPKTYRDFYTIRYIVQNGFACYIAKVKSGKPYEVSINSSSLFDSYNGPYLYNDQLDKCSALSQLLSDINNIHLFTAKSSIVGENTLSLRLIPLKPYSINQVVLEVVFKNRATSTSEEVEIASTRVSLSPDTKNADLVKTINAYLGGDIILHLPDILNDAPYATVVDAQDIIEDDENGNKYICISNLLLYTCGVYSLVPDADAGGNPVAQDSADATFANPYLLLDYMAITEREIDDTTKRGLSACPTWTSLYETKKETFTFAVEPIEESTLSFSQADYTRSLNLYRDPKYAGCFISELSAMVTKVKTVSKDIYKPRVFSRVVNSESYSADKRYYTKKDESKPATYDYGFKTEDPVEWVEGENNNLVLVEDGTNPFDPPQEGKKTVYSIGTVSCTYEEFSGQLTEENDYIKKDESIEDLTETVLPGDAESNFEVLDNTLYTLSEVSCTYQLNEEPIEQEVTYYVKRDPELETLTENVLPGSTSSNFEEWDGTSGDVTRYTMSEVSCEYEPLTGSIIKGKKYYVQKNESSEGLTESVLPDSEESNFTGKIIYSLSLVSVTYTKLEDNPNAIQYVKKEESTVELTENVLPGDPNSNFEKKVEGTNDTYKKSIWEASTYEVALRGSLIDSGKAEGEVGAVKAAVTDGKSVFYVKDNGKYVTLEFPDDTVTHIVKGNTTQDITSLVEMSSDNRRGLHYIIKQIAALRKDLTCVFTTPYHPEEDGDEGIFDLNKACNWVAARGDYTNLFEYGNSQAIDYSEQAFYCEMYWSWVKWRAVKLVNGLATGSATIEVPATGFVILNSLSSFRVKGSFYPVAGDQGGVIPDSCTILQNPSTKSQRDKLISYRINPIFDTGLRGIQIYGNDTLNPQYTDLSAAHISRTLVQIRSRVDRYSETIKFKLNDKYTWGSWINYVTTRILEPIKAAGGLQWYSCDMGYNTTTRDEIAQRKIRGQISLQFTQALEIVDLEFVVYSSALDMEAEA